MTTKSRPDGLGPEALHPLVVLGDFRATVGAAPLGGALERGQLDRPCQEN
ncbi:hypothetical protein ACVWZ6_002391 [Bradyrhizobium sp. GM6.1]